MTSVYIVGGMASGLSGSGEDVSYPVAVFTTRVLAEKYIAARVEEYGTPDYAPEYTIDEQPLDPMETV